MGIPSIFLEGLGKPLKTAGFKRKASTWYSDHEEIISVLNLQKSSYGFSQYYINIALWLNCLGSAESPKEQHCHIRCRWSAIVPADEKRLERVLDLSDATIPDQTRVDELQQLLDAYIIPWFLKTASFKGLRDFYHTPLSTKCLIRKEARALLEHDSDQGNSIVENR